MSQESDLQGQIDRAWKKIEDIRELVGHQGDLLVRTMAMAGIMCFRCGRTMAGTIDKNRALLSFSCDRCGAGENYVIPGDMTERRDESPLVEGRVDGRSPLELKVVGLAHRVDHLSETECVGCANLRAGIESLDRGAKMEAQDSLELRRMIGVLAGRVEGLEAAERTGCPEGYFTVNGGPLRPCLVTLLKKSRQCGHTEAAIRELEWRAEAKKPWVAPTCGTCRWFKQDDPSLLFDPKRTGMCQAHPCVWAKMADMTCGEHSPQ